MHANSTPRRLTDTPSPVFQKEALLLWRSAMIFGGVLLALGFLAIVMPRRTTLAIDLVLGLIFTVAGLWGFAMVLSARAAALLPSLVLSSALLCAAGALLLILPAAGIKALTIVLMIFFLTHGLAAIALAFSSRFALPGAMVWSMMAGLMDIGLCILIALEWPDAAEWTIGLLAGINLASTGISFLLYGWYARRIATA